MSNILIKAHTLIIDTLGDNVILGPETVMHSFRNVTITNSPQLDISAELMHGDITYILIDGIGFGSIQKVSVVDGEISIDYDTEVYFGSDEALE